MKIDMVLLSELWVGGYDIIRSQESGIRSRGGVRSKRVGVRVIL